MTLEAYLEKSNEIRECISVELREAPEDPQHFRRRFHKVYERLMESIWNYWLRQLTVPKERTKDIKDEYHFLHNIKFAGSKTR